MDMIEKAGRAALETVRVETDSGDVGAIILLVPIEGEYTAGAANVTTNLPPTIVTQILRDIADNFELQTDN